MNNPSIVERVKFKIKQHWIALTVCLFIGLLSICPQVFFIFHLGSEYQGIPFLQTANEDGYLGIMKEIESGHVLAASVPFFEYKDTYPMIPPTFAIFYVVFSKIFHISLVSTLLISKFFLPAILFFLVYLFIYRLSKDSDCLAGKINAIAGGLLVVLGFDLVDYRTVWNFLQGQGVLGYSIIWTRPVNPISGGILVFTFLLCLWSLIFRRRFYVILLASLSLALMMASYFFSWTLALSVMGVVSLVSLLKKEWKFVRSTLMILGLAALFSALYWFMVWQASKLPWANEAAARMGLFPSRTPHFNKFVLATLFVFLIVSCLVLYSKRRIKNLKEVPKWWWFCLALLLGGFIVYNQQVITGKEIWYHHFVFYTIPFGFVALTILFGNFVRPVYFKSWVFFVSIAIGASLFCAISIQYSSRQLFYHYENLQKYASAFDFLNTKTTKDCVVLSDEGEDTLNNLINAFTRCDTYHSTEIFVIAPPDRFYHNYMVSLRLRGIGAEEIDEYLKENSHEAAINLHYQMQYFSGYVDKKLENNLKKFPSDYQEFLQKDFYQELKKYRLNYILSVGPLREDIKGSLPGLVEVFKENNVFIYSLS